MIKRVQRAARKYNKNKRRVANRVFDKYAQGPTSGPRGGVATDSDTITVKELRKCLRQVRIDHGHPHEDPVQMSSDLDHILTNIFDLAPPPKTAADAEPAAAVDAPADTVTVTRLKFRTLLPRARRWKADQEKYMTSSASALEMLRRVTQKDRVQQQLDLHHTTQDKLAASKEKEESSASPGK